MTRRPPCYVHLVGGPRDGRSFEWVPDGSIDRILVPYLDPPMDPLSPVAVPIEGPEPRVAEYELTRIVRGLFVAHRDGGVSDLRPGYHATEAVYTYREDR